MAQHGAILKQIFRSVNVKNKYKIHPKTGIEDPEGEERCSCTLSLTSALDGGGGLSHRPGRLTPGMDRYPLYRGLGGPHGPSGLAPKTSLVTGFDTRAVEPLCGWFETC